MNGSQYTIARRTLLIAGLGAAALAASPAAACSLTATRRRPASYYSDARARALLERLITEANRGRDAGIDRLNDIGMSVFPGEGVSANNFIFDWFSQLGRRDNEPGALVGMNRLAEGRTKRLYLTAVRRSVWREASEGDSCANDSPAGHYRRIEAWLYNFAPEDGSTLRRAPELDVHLRAFVPEAAEELSRAW
ncbi:MAG TPA: hypothetical protein VEW25_04715 [Allosphingosinicella sp.]|nr:hypothetical protein [Allosphingosinicella sp.]